MSNIHKGSAGVYCPLYLGLMTDGCMTGQSHCTAEVVPIFYLNLNDFDWYPFTIFGSNKKYPVICILHTLDLGA